MQEVTDEIQKVVKDLFDVEEQVELTRTDEQFGDYATNVALRLSKKVDQDTLLKLRISGSPREIAESIIQNLHSDAITIAEVAGPGFINLRINEKFMAHQLQALVEVAPGGIFGANESGKGSTVICEFPSPNMAKPFSVGHIRSALQGWAIAQVMRLSGYNVITDNHVGDAGTPFGKWVVGYLRYSSRKQLEEDGINELARVYIEITAAMKAEKAAGDHELLDEVQSWLQKLENGDKEAVEYSRQFNQISFNHMHQVMERLGISTEFEYGESYFVKRGKELADELLVRGVARKSDGAIIVDLDEFEIDTPIMLKKANGTALYATTDLATMEFRDKTWHPDKVFIHTGQEQAFYFKQLNALAKKAGFKSNIIHLWHGLVDQLDEEGKRSKMSSRKGVVLLNDLLDEAEKHAATLAPEGSEEAIKAVALAAVKFTDFTADRKKGVLFDWETMFSVQGFSGPAVQYAAVRINSILEKTSIQPSEPSDNYDWKAERVLLLELLEFPQLVYDLSVNYEMHKLAAYLYNLARVINRYYEKTPILKSDQKKQANRLWLLDITQRVLQTGLDILGISIPKKM